MTQQLWNLILQESILSERMRLAVSILACIAGIVGWIGFVARKQYLSKLALRIRDLRVASTAGRLRYTLGIPAGMRMWM
jgi:hypothetical protein